MRTARFLLAAVVSAMLLGSVGCRSSQKASGLTTVKLQADWYPQPEQGGFYDAIVKGFYKDEGLDVQILPGGPYISSEPLVASGAVQFGMNTSDHVLESIANSNEPIVAVGATMQHDPQGILVRANSTVHTWTDLNGRTVAVKPGSTWWEFMVKKFRLDGVHEIPATYSVANFLQDPSYIQQCFVTSEPYFARKSGAAVRTMLISDSGYQPYRVVFASTAFLHDHPDLVAKFVRASIRGWRDYLSDPTVANAEISKLNPAMNNDQMQFSTQTLKDEHFITGSDPSEIGHFTPERWSTMYQQLIDLKVVTNPIDPKSAYTTQFLDASTSNPL